MSTLAREPVSHPAAWRSSEFASRDDLAVELAPRHLRALQAAADALAASPAPPGELGPAHVPLADIASDVARWRDEVRDGRGLLILRGFPVGQVDEATLERMYFGLGLHFGRPVSQSKMGDLVGHVVNVGNDDRRERAYRNRLELHLHTDRCDHVAMLCIRPAWKGGVSGYASALTVHNLMREEHPALLECLYRGYRLHRFGEQRPGEPPVTPVPVPVFSWCQGRFSVIYLRGYVDLAESEYGITPTSEEREALTVFEATADRPDVRLDFTLEPGEAAFFNNCHVLHTRSAFEDHPDPALKRHLLRLWLMEDGRPAVEGARLHKGDGGITPQAGQGTYYAGRGAA